jgi:PleD family two-component response regulator
LVVEAGLSRESIVAPWRYDAIKSVAVLLLLLVGLAAFGGVVLRQLRERIAIERALLQAHQTLKALALTDSLTGLGNRRRLDGVFEPELRRARRQGYPGAGDARPGLLQGLQRPLRSPGWRPVLATLCRRAAAGLETAGRSGGALWWEEFTLLLPDTDGRGAELLVQELRQLVRRQALEHAASPLGRVSFSAGVAVVDLAREGVTAEALVAAADRGVVPGQTAGAGRVLRGG